MVKVLPHWKDTLFDAECFFRNPMPKKPCSVDDLKNTRDLCCKIVSNCRHLTWKMVGDYASIPNEPYEVTLRFLYNMDDSMRNCFGYMDAIVKYEEAKDCAEIEAIVVKPGEFMYPPEKPMTLKGELHSWMEVLGMRKPDPPDYTVADVEKFRKLSYRIVTRFHDLSFGMVHRFMGHGKFESLKALLVSQTRSDMRYSMDTFIEYVDELGKQCTKYPKRRK